MIERYRMIETAEKVATHAHDTQMYGDKPYIVHPMDVADFAQYLGYPLEVVVICLLHDVVEDSNITLEDLLEMGFPQFIVDGVESVTYTNKDEEKGIDKIDKARANKLEQVVKFCDSSRNLLAALSENTTSKTPVAKVIERLDRYIGYLAALKVDLPTPDEIDIEIRRLYQKMNIQDDSSAATIRNQSAIESS